MKIKWDTRPRCTSVSSKGKPCDLHSGHKGKHEWTGMTGQQHEEWK